MKRIILVLFTTGLVVSCSISKMKKSGIYEEPSAKNYLTYLQDSTIQIIDVRTPQEYEVSHIEGAINVNYLDTNFANILDSLSIDKNKPLLIYGERQNHSQSASKVLYAVGYTKIIDLNKGMRNWKKNGFPITSDSLQLH